MDKIPVCHTTKVAVEIQHELGLRITGFFMQIQVTEGNGFFLLQQEGWDGMATVILTTKQYAKQAGEQPVGERVKITG